jgi:hypothetical protein
MIACLDLEGVLRPEIWINVAERTGIAELRRTTRDEPDYDKLMRSRLAILDAASSAARHPARDRRHGPMLGAREFLSWLRERAQVIILSDTFYAVRGSRSCASSAPVLFCNQLEIDAGDRIAATGCASRTASGARSRRCARSTSASSPRATRTTTRRCSRRGRAASSSAAAERHRRVSAISRDDDLRRSAHRIREPLGRRDRA